MSRGLCGACGEWFDDVTPCKCGEYWQRVRIDPKTRALSVAPVVTATIQPADDSRKHVWIDKDRNINWRDYPIGTKARESWGNGGHWIKTDYGWKWCTGSTFPTPGGADQVMLPTDDPRKAMLEEIRVRLSKTRWIHSTTGNLVGYDKQQVDKILNEMEAKL